MDAINNEEQEILYKRRWWTFAVLALAILIVVIDHTILNVALPTLQRALGATVSQLQWIVDAYILAFATLLLTMGTLGDRIGRARMLRLGMIVFGLGSLAAVMAGSAAGLIGSRMLMGVGAAMIMPATLAIITNIFPPDERCRAIGAWGAMNGLGVALGPLLGGWLLNHFSWNSVFFINLPIVIAALILGIFLVPESRDPTPRRLDFQGTLLSIVTIWLLVFGLIKAGDWGWTHPVVLGSLAGFGAFGVVFVFIEKYGEAPMLDLGLFRNSRLSAGSGSIAVMTSAMFGTLFALTMYMQFVKNYSPLQTGLGFLPMAFGYALGSVSSNRAVNSLGTKVVVAAGFCGLAVMSLIMAFWRIDTPYWQIGLLLFASSYFMGNIMTPSLNAVLGAVPKAVAGVGSAIGNASFQIGGALGVAALGSILTGVLQGRRGKRPCSAAAPPGRSGRRSRQIRGRGHDRGRHVAGGLAKQSVHAGREKLHGRMASGPALHHRCRRGRNASGLEIHAGKGNPGPGVIVLAAFGGKMESEKNRR